MKKILVIDDNLELLTMIKQVLTTHQYHAEIASDPLLALNILQKQHFKLIISDIDMPQIDGITLAEKIRQLQIDTPILFMSGHQKNKAWQKITNAHFIAKPFTLTDLLKKISLL